MDKDKELRKHLTDLLTSGNAHIDFESTVKDFPIKSINGRVENIPYTPWQVLEHMRIAQWDILEFSRNAKHVSPSFPDGYWPPADAKADAAAWTRTIEAFGSDLKQMEALVNDPATDLFAKIPHGDGQTILREALLVADHNAYHVGVMLALKRALATDRQLAAG
jgi:hypothetical protein